MRLHPLLRPLLLTPLLLLTVVSPAPASTVDDLDLFTSVLARVEHLYVDEIDRQSLVESAVQGMLMQLDFATVYLPPEEYDSFMGEIRGHYAGIGVRVQDEEEGLRVLEVFAESPADHAGLAAQDLIVAVDGKSVHTGKEGDPIESIRGPVGTTVTVDLLRGTDPLSLEVMRAVVHPPAVDAQWLDPGNAWVRIYEFQEGAAQDLGKTLRAYKKEGMTGLVLDLRGNPGGAMQEAVGMADLFLDRGVIVRTRGRDGSEEVQKAHRKNTFEDLNVVVLVDAGSASASEILAGALRENGAAPILGEVSYGKGTVQQVFPLPNGGGLKITVARYYLPSGRTIDQVGIVPDAQVPFGGRAELEAWEDQTLAPRALAVLDMDSFPEDAQLAAARAVLDEPALIDLAMSNKKIEAPPAP